MHTGLLYHLLHPLYFCEGLEINLYQSQESVERLKRDQGNYLWNLLNCGQRRVEP